MAYIHSSTLPFLSFLLFLSLAHAQYTRAPHGLAFENPMSFPPSAFEFFHPKCSPPAYTRAPCAEPACAPLSALPDASSKARADPVRETVWSAQRTSGGVGAGGVATIVLGLVFVVLVAMGASYVMVKRRANSRRASTIIQPDA